MENNLIDQARQLCEELEYRLIYSYRQAKLQRLLILATDRYARRLAAYWG